MLFRQDVCMCVCRWAAESTVAIFGYTLFIIIKYVLSFHILFLHGT